MRRTDRISPPPLLAPSLVLFAAVAAPACGGLVVDDARASEASADAEAAADVDGDAPLVPPRSAWDAAPPADRTLDAFRAGVVGVWEGDVTLETLGGPSCPSRVRIEFRADGSLDTKRISVDPPPGCTSAAMEPLPDSDPRDTYEIDRLTAGGEGMGAVRGPYSEGKLPLHRIRLSADGRRLDFTFFLLNIDERHYWLTRVE